MPLIKAIPTRFRGVEFRSRLEARWAAFFDLCGWSWDYEPLDLEGWTPDFGIKGPGDLVFVEVKPIEVDGEADANPVFAKAVRHARCVSVLLLGLAPRGVPGLPVGAVLSKDASLADFLTPPSAIGRWRKAGNAVQWRGQARDASRSRP